MRAFQEPGLTMDLIRYAEEMEIAADCLERIPEKYRLDMQIKTTIRLHGISSSLG